MKAVIQCAGRKDPKAEKMRAADGREVLFVGQPSEVSASGGYWYARPDDCADGGRSWRDELLAYNRKYRNAEVNPLELLPAYQLYEPANSCYGELVAHLGIENVYILSAGWGLIPADFLTPYYDITFTNQADPYKRRKKSDQYDDFNFLNVDSTDTLLFFGCGSYRKPFRTLTENYRGKRICFYNSATEPNMPGVITIYYPHHDKRKWHYKCAADFIAGKIKLPS